MKKLMFSVTKDDCKMETFCSGGKGGQNQNKRFTGVRFTHAPSGAVGESREERDQLQNKRTAWKRMSEHPKFKIWAKRRINEIEFKQTIEEQVEEMMKPENLKVEVVGEDGKWVTE